MSERRHHKTLDRRSALALLGAFPGLVALLGVKAVSAQTRSTYRPLASWNDSPARDAILAFVDEVTSEPSSYFIPPQDRIAVFDNDGTLWCEHPMYVQLAFALDRVKELAPAHPEWQSDALFKAALDNDLKALSAFGERGLLKLVLVTHVGMTTREFEQIVTTWLSTARHPRFKRPYTELVYQPMLELMAYLKTMDFEIHIVSGGGIEFMRPWSEPVYGIPPQRVVGSSIKTRFEFRDGVPELFRLSELNFVADGPGKPIGINEHIGRRPVMAFGNSDGDLEMLQWTTSGARAGFGLLVHHTDAEREYAYNTATDFGRLDKALAAATQNNWVVADMKRDWATIFPAEK